MMGIVLVGMALSIVQLIAEIVERSRLAAATVERDEALRRLYSPQSAPQDVDDLSVP